MLNPSSERDISETKRIEREFNERGPASFGIMSNEPRMSGL